MTKVLFVVTGTTFWLLNDGTRHPTGYWAEEFVAPYRVFKKAGYEIVVATPGGVVPTVDQLSLTPEMAGSAEIARAEIEVIEAADELRKPIVLADARVADYDAVYYPGGHGPMEDLWRDQDSGALLIAALHSGKPLAVVCHAPAALLATKQEDGTTPFAGYRVTSFTNEEEQQAGFASRAPWLVQTELVKLGLKFEEGEPWKVNLVTDRNLHTGQNPASSGPLAEELAKILG
jgi:putative intracellular protease/amidase